MLRIDRRRFARTDAEEQRIELIDLIQEAAFGGEVRRRFKTSGGKRPNRIDAVHQQSPIFVGVVGGRETTS